MLFVDESAHPLPSAAMFAGDLIAVRRHAIVQIAPARTIRACPPSAFSTEPGGRSATHAAVSCDALRRASHVGATEPRRRRHKLPLFGRGICFGLLRPSHLCRWYLDINILSMYSSANSTFFLCERRSRSYTITLNRVRKCRWACKPAAQHGLQSVLGNPFR